MTEKVLVIDDVLTGEINRILESLSSLFYDATHYQSPHWCHSMRSQTLMTKIHTPLFNNVVAYTYLRWASFILWRRPIDTLYKTYVNLKRI